MGIPEEVFCEMGLTISLTECVDRIESTLRERGKIPMGRSAIIAAVHSISQQYPEVELQQDLFQSKLPNQRARLPQEFDTRNIINANARGEEA